MNIFDFKNTGKAENLKLELQALQKYQNGRTKSERKKDNYLQRGYIRKKNRNKINKKFKLSNLNFYFFNILLNKLKRIANTLETSNSLYEYFIMILSFLNLILNLNLNLNLRLILN